MVQDLIDQARQEGFDLGENTASELREFIASELDPGDEVLSAFDDLADAYLESSEAESLDATPAEGMLDFVTQMQTNDEDDADGNEVEGDGEMGGQVSMEDLEQVKSVVGEVAEHLGDIKDMLSAREEDRETTMEELERRLSELEDEPVGGSRARGKEEGFLSGSDGVAEEEEFVHEDVYL